MVFSIVDSAQIGAYLHVVTQPSNPILPQALPIDDQYRGSVHVMASHTEPTFDPIVVNNMLRGSVRQLLQSSPNQWVQLTIDLCQVATVQSKLVVLGLVPNPENEDAHSMVGRAFRRQTSPFPVRMGEWRVISIRRIEEGLFPTLIIIFFIFPVFFILFFVHEFFIIQTG